MGGEDRREYFAHFRQFDKDGQESDLFNMVAFFTYFDHNWESSGANFRNRPLTVKPAHEVKWKLGKGEENNNWTRTYC
ncbi:MAG TPA: hypothetical protein PKV84_05965 [Candidatus Omnitrophota bacterium]|nr:hypothetical protein [Candidatus Omnitrophota bacterium]